jgi:putative transposase
MLAAAKPIGKGPITTRKAVSFGYSASKELSALFGDFQLMCNEAIRIAIQENPKNRFRLIESAYARLKEYHLHTHYVLSACEIAFSAYKNKKRKAIPHICSAFIKLDNQSYQLNHLLLRIPTSPKNFVFLTLQGSEYHQSFIDNPRLKRGSVIITPNWVTIAFSNVAEPFEPMGFIGIDVNERNVTVSGTDGWHKQFGELGDVAEIKERYKDIRASISQKIGRDRRIAKELLAKYGNRERQRTESLLHKVTKQITSYAKDNKLGIKMERLTGIRRLYRRGNRQGPSFRGRMNAWAFGETQRQVDYKSKWDGVPCWYVNPRGTSSYCLCGSRVVSSAARKLYCPKCDRTWDRDDLASKNIMACAVPQARPSRGSHDEEQTTTAPIL